MKYTLSDKVQVCVFLGGGVNVNHCNIMI